MREFDEGSDEIEEFPEIDGVPVCVGSASRFRCFDGTHGVKMNIPDDPEGEPRYRTASGGPQTEYTVDYGLTKAEANFAVVQLNELAEDADVKSVDIRPRWHGLRALVPIGSGMTEKDRAISDLAQMIDLERRKDLK